MLVIINCFLGSFPFLPSSSPNLCGLESRSWVWSFLRKSLSKCGKAKMASGIGTTLPWLSEKESCFRVHFKRKWSDQALEVLFTPSGCKLALMLQTSSSQPLKESWTTGLSLTRSLWVLRTACRGGRSKMTSRKRQRRSINCTIASWTNIEMRNRSKIRICIKEVRESSIHSSITSIQAWTTNCQVCRR